MSLKLHEIVAELDDVLELAYTAADNNDGEIPEELADEMDRLEMQRSTKIANIARFLKNLKAEGVAVGDEARKLNKRKQALDNKTEWLKNYLQAMMKPGEKFKDAVVSIYWNTRDSLLINNSDAIPMKYQNEAVPIFDKKAILNALKNNEEIDGVEITPNTFIVIR